MSEHIRRIFIAIAIFAGATLVYQKWREGHPEPGLFDLVAGKTVAASAGTPLRSRDLPGLAQFNEESAKLAAAVLPSIVSVNIGSSGIVAKRDIFGFLRGYGTGVVATGLGSGVIVSREGHILTNLHVVKNAQQIQVTTNDRKTHEAKLLGADADLDVAVLQIADAAGYPPLPFADSDKTRVGEMAFAFGSPFGFDFTVSRGIVSATQRRLSDIGNDYIQTDTVINPGNSGGPLVNFLGEIIGINVSILTDNQNAHSWQGIGLALPANDAKAAFDAVLGKNPRIAGYLGIDVDMLRIQSNVQAAYGAIVTGVTAGSPAQKAGLLEGDIIAQYNGASFETERDFLRLLGRAKPGQTVTLTVLRKNQPLTITAKIESRPPGL
jgi:serine protease Do